MGLLACVTVGFNNEYALLHGFSSVQAYRLTVYLGFASQCQRPKPSLLRAEARLLVGCRQVAFPDYPFSLPANASLSSRLVPFVDYFLFTYGYRLLQGDLFFVSRSRSVHDGG